MDARTPSMSKKKMSSAFKGYLILVVMVFISWLVFKILTPDNFGTLDNMLDYFQASLIASAGAVGFYLVIVMACSISQLAQPSSSPASSAACWQAWATVTSVFWAVVS